MDTFYLFVIDTLHYPFTLLSFYLNYPQPISQQYLSTFLFNYITFTFDRYIVKRLTFVSLL